MLGLISVPADPKWRGPIRPKEYQTSGWPKKILVMDDDVTEELKLKAVLKKIYPDARVDWASSIDMAKERSLIFRAGLGAKYDLILADMVLAESRTGLDFLREIQPHYRADQLVLMSSRPYPYLAKAYPEVDDFRGHLVFFHKSSSVRHWERMFNSLHLQRLAQQFSEFDPKPRKASKFKKRGKWWSQVWSIAIIFTAVGLSDLGPPVVLDLEVLKDRMQMDLGLSDTIEIPGGAAPNRDPIILPKIQEFAEEDQQ